MRTSWRGHHQFPERESALAYWGCLATGPKFRDSYSMLVCNGFAASKLILNHKRPDGVTSDG